MLELCFGEDLRFTFEFRVLAGLQLEGYFLLWLLPGNFLLWLFDGCSFQFVS